MLHRGPEDDSGNEGYLPLAKLDDVQSEEQIALRRLDEAQLLALGALEECKFLTARGLHYLPILRFLSERPDHPKDIGQGIFSGLDCLVTRLTDHISVALSTRLLLLAPDPKISKDPRELTCTKAALKELFKAAHDVNNMLGIVRGYLELAAMGIQTIEKLTTVKTALMKIEAILHEATTGPERKSQNLAEALSVLEGEKGGLECSFAADIQESERSALVSISAIDLGRLVFNLLDNAKKVGATAAKINVVLSDGMLVIWVKDNGSGFKGIAPLEASRLSREADSAHGNGIGICDELCRNAGGTLTLLNKDDSTGAEFLISLPIREASQH